MEEELREKYNELMINEEQLEHNALHDYLTDLPNRKYMYTKFEEAFLVRLGGDEFVFLMKNVFDRNSVDYFAK